MLTKVPGITDNLADQVARIVRSIRQLELKKAPSVSETLDWARTLVLLGIDSIDAEQAKETLHILLKYQTDIAKAAKELSGSTCSDLDLTSGARPARRVHPGAARRPGCPCRSPRTSTPWRRSAHPARGPRGVQVRAGRHAGEEPRPLEGLRDRLRGLLLAAGPAVRRSTPTTTTSGNDQLAERSREMGEPGRPGRRAAMEAMTPEELAEMLYRALRNGDEAMMRALARQAVHPLRGHGAGPAGRRHLLPLPDAAEPRPRQRARAADARPRARTRRRAHRRSRSGSSATSTRTASTSSARRSRPRSAAGWWPTAASRPWPARCASRCPRTSTSCTPAARRCSPCARRSTR